MPVVGTTASVDLCVYCLQSIG